MKVNIKDIRWDTDGEDIEGLPTEIEVDISEIYPSIADDISDWLSDKYGFCHNGFGYTLDK